MRQVKKVRCRNVEIPKLKKKSDEATTKIVRTETMAYPSFSMPSKMKKRRRKRTSRRQLKKYGAENVSLYLYAT